MQILTADRLHLAQDPELNGVQIAWDATSLTSFKTCPRKYYYEMLCGWRKKSISAHLTFGHLFHKAGEYYAHSMAKNSSHELAVNYVVRNLLNESANWFSDDVNKNKNTLIRSVIWYLDEYKNSPFEQMILPNGKAATEVSFNFPLPNISPTGENYILCGHLDEVRITRGGSIFIFDKKTTKNAPNAAVFNAFTPDVQMTLYYYAGQFLFDKPITGLCIDATQVLANSARFAREFITRSPSQLNEFVENIVFTFKQAEICAKEKHWPMNETACSKFGSCAFRKICILDREVRELFIGVDFEINPWNPLVER